MRAHPDSPSTGRVAAESSGSAMRVRRASGRVPRGADRGPPGRCSVVGRKVITRVRPPPKCFGAAFLRLRAPGWGSPGQWPRTPGWVRRTLRRPGDAGPVKNPFQSLYLQRRGPPRKRSRKPCGSPGGRAAHLSITRCPITRCLTPRRGTPHRPPLQGAIPRCLTPPQETARQGTAVHRAPMARCRFRGV